LLPSLVQTRVRFSDPSLRDFEDQELKDIYFLSPEDHFAIELLLGAFLWLDILAHVSTRAKLSSQFNHEVLLERGNIQLESLFGCKNWAMLLIFKVSQLDNWKRECEENRKLNVAELVRQGVKIEAALNQGLAGISSQNTSQMRTSSNFTPEDQCSAITEVFALAALTYLHVVVSGAHPDQPEINDSVARAMDALGALRDRKLLARVVWPACVTGCMVSEDK
jgi:C6 transcription factor Pro1